MRRKGSAGGHNGIKNIEMNLGTKNYKRLKIGISNDKTIDTKNICSLLKKKLFDHNGEYHTVWQEIQNDDSLTAITRSRQLHVYRNGKKILILSGKTQPKIIRDDKINLQYTSKMI